MKSFLKKKWREWKGTLFLILFVFVPVRSSLSDWNWVPSGSMNPTIVEGDLIYVNKLAYDLRVPLTLHRLTQWSDPGRGDIALLFSPQDNKRLVKRVIGIPGDEIEMKNNILFINDKRLNYSHLPETVTRDLPDRLRQASLFADEDLLGHKHPVMSTPCIPTTARSFPKIILPEDCYFVMGDNRDNSKDSRFFGFAERRLFIGKATGIIVSFDKLDKFQPKFGRFFSTLQ